MLLDKTVEDKGEDRVTTYATMKDVIDHLQAHTFKYSDRQSFDSRAEDLVDRFEPLIQKYSTDLNYRMSPADRQMMYMTEATVELCLKDPFRLHFGWS